MFFFLATFAPGACPVPPEGWTAAGEPFRLSRTLEAAQIAADVPGMREGRVLVLDRAALGGLDGAESPVPTAADIPRAAVVNVDPDGDLWTPVPIVAAGGVVARHGADGLEVLMIFRRGCWDLAKGKLDEGESIPACALREVSEEVGIPLGSLTITSELGTTVHGYPLPRKGKYAVKTTHWYGMTTTAEAFEAQDDEGIEAVAWIPLDEAATRVGYESLRTFLQRLDAVALGLPAPDPVGGLAQG